MPRPTETALKGRARGLLEAMTARARWIYAVPSDLGSQAARPIALAAGLVLEEEEPGALAARFGNEKRTASLVTFESPAGPADARLRWSSVSMGNRMKAARKLPVFRICLRLAAVAGAACLAGCGDDASRRPRRRRQRSS